MEPYSVEVGKFDLDRPLPLGEIEAERRRLSKLSHKWFGGAILCLVIMIAVLAVRNFKVADMAGGMALCFTTLGMVICILLCQRAHRRHLAYLEVDYSEIIRLEQELGEPTPQVLRYREQVAKQGREFMKGELFLFILHAQIILPSARAESRG